MDSQVENTAEKQDASKSGGRLILVSALALIALVLIGGYWLLSDENWRRFVSTEYVIPNVPYIGLYNHVGRYALVGSGKSSTVAMVLEYWNPGKNNFDAVRRTLDNPDTLTDTRTLIQAIPDLGDYSVHRERLKMSDLGKYINPETRTPLLLFLPFDGQYTPDEQSAYDERPVSRMILLIGKNDREKQLVFHDYWLGSNYTLSFSDFDRLQNQMMSEQKDYYFVVRPKGSKTALTGLKTGPSVEYPARTEMMKALAPVMDEYGIGYSLILRSQHAKAAEYLSTVERAPEFQTSAPAFIKTKLHYYQGLVYLNEKDFPNALEYAQKAISFNKDIDKPFLDWPGYQFAMNRPSGYGVDSLPYELAGDAYARLDKLEEARGAYMKAIEIYPKNRSLSEKITVIENKLLWIFSD